VLAVDLAVERDVAAAGAWVGAALPLGVLGADGAPPQAATRALPASTLPLIRIA
jgi:hypothetical protein